MSIINTDKHPARDALCCKQDDRMALCRCWQSKKFPYCDGSHNEYNQRTGDSLGPIIITDTNQD